MSMQNLDQLCAQFGYKIATQVHGEIGKNAENHVTRSLGVLQENGVYAFFLYQESRGDKGAEKTKEQAAELLKRAKIDAFLKISDSLEAVRGDGQTPGLAGNLDDLLLAKRLLEQALIYARYHAKAIDEGKDKAKTEKGTKTEG